MSSGPPISTKVGATGTRCAARGVRICHPWPPPAPGRLCLPTPPDVDMEGGVISGCNRGFASAGPGRATPLLQHELNQCPPITIKKTQDDKANNACSWPKVTKTPSTTERGRRRSLRTMVMLLHLINIGMRLVSMCTHKPVAVPLRRATTNLARHSAADATRSVCVSTDSDGGRSGPSEAQQNCRPQGRSHMGPYPQKVRSNPDSPNELSTPSQCVFVLTTSGGCAC